MNTKNEHSLPPFARENFGLSGNAIKIIGIVLMIFDHLHQMFYTHGAPLWFTWIGRPVLPIFIFMCVEGWTHTRSKKKYLLHLFIGFELMNIISAVLTFLMQNEDVVLMNNVFQTLLFSALYMLFIEMFADGIKKKKAAKIAFAVFLILLPLPLSIWTLSILNNISDSVPRALTFLLYPFTPNLFATEGGFTAIIMGILFYLLRKKRALQMAGFAAFCVLSLVTFLRAGNSLFSGSAQWLMIFALIPIALYNGKRGNGNKYFFYIFYPAHIYLFYIIAWFVK